MTYLGLLAGFVLLLAGGEFLVRGAAALALRLGLSHLVVGIVIVGFGTSVPELVASIQAALAGAPGIAMGNVVGSNIANILLILGVGAIIYPILCSQAAVFRDGLVMVLAAVLLGVACYPGVLSQQWGLVFIALLIGYLGYLLYSDRRNNGKEAAPQDDVPQASSSIWLDILLVVGGTVAVVLGGKLLVDNAIIVAKSFEVSDEVGGLTLVAIGTSLPELATSIIAAVRKHSDIALGNVLGSNIYNILGIAGITAVISPIPVSEEMLKVNIAVMIGASLVLAFIALVVKRFGKRVGFAFLAGYAAFIYTAVA